MLLEVMRLNAILLTMIISEVAGLATTKNHPASLNLGKLLMLTPYEDDLLVLLS